MKVEIHNPGNLQTIDYRKLKEFQGNLKEFREKEYAKLKNSFNELGFVFPFFVWFNEAGEAMTIDGHGRLRLMRTENVTGKNGEYEFPFVPIEAKSREHAKKLLLVATSQYQRVTQEGLYEFAYDIDDSWMAETINFDAVFSGIAGAADIDLGDFFSEDNTKESDSKSKIVLEYTEEDYDKVIEAFKAHKGSKEEIVFNLLGL